MTKIPIKESIRFGWDKFWERPSVFVEMTFVTILVRVAAWFIHVHVGPIGGLISLGLNALLLMGVIAFSLKAFDSVATVQLEDLWHPNPYWKFIGALIVTIIITLPISIPIIILMVFLGLPAILLGSQGFYVAFYVVMYGLPLLGVLLAFL